MIRSRSFSAVGVGLLVVGLIAGAAPAAGVAARQLSDPAKALLRKRDMPKGWSRYEPVKKNSRFGVCGEPNAKREPRSEASIAFAVDPDYGPLFGERIEVVGRRAARAEIERRAELSLPCEWDQYGSHWRAVTEQLAGLEAENVVYRIDNVSGPRTFNYEVAVRRKGVLILLVLNTRTQEDRVLLTPLVVQALARYDQAAS